MPSDPSGAEGKGTRGLQEERVERDAWAGVLHALTRLKEARARERAQGQASGSGTMQTGQHI